MARPTPIPEIDAASLSAAPTAAATPTRYRGEVASDSIMSQETRDVLGNEFDQQIAGTGGIQSVTATETPAGALRVTVEGTVGASMGRANAPNFNSSSKLMRAGELGLSGDDWERAHVWGPGFGDEAAAGIWYASEEVNQLLQNRVSEDFIRDLANEAATNGGSLDLKATAVRFTADELPDAQRQGDFLKEIRYELTLKDGDGNAMENLRVEFTLNPPPDGSMSEFECDERSRPVIEGYVDALRRDS